jgi:hypothetical protein
MLRILVGQQGMADFCFSGIYHRDCRKLVTELDVPEAGEQMR